MRLLQLIICLVALFSHSIALAQPAAPKGRAPLPTAADPQGDKVLSDALLNSVIEKLTTEYMETVGKGAKPVRTKATYFIDSPVTLSQVSLLNALEKPIANDPRLTVYVRRQLLTGVKPGEWDKALLPRVAEIYRKAPFPSPRYGSTEVDRKKLDVALAKAKDDEALKLTDVVTDAVTKGEAANAILMAYRDELYVHLPIGQERFLAGYRDAFERAAMGWQPEELMERIDREATIWGSSNVADPRHYAAVAQVVYRLRSERTPKSYVGVALSRATKKPAWVSRSEAIYNVKKLAELQKVLEDAAGIRRPSADDVAKARAKIHLAAARHGE